MDRFQPSRARFWLFVGAAILIIGLPINPLTAPDFLVAAQFNYPSKRLWLAPFNMLALVLGTVLICQRRTLAETLMVGRSGRLLAILSAIAGAMAYAGLECGSLFVPLTSLDAQITYMYRDYYLFSPAPQSTADVEFTNYYSARRVPCNFELAAADQVIWFFGGSTMQDVAVCDDETIVNHAVRSLSEKGVSAHAKNFGTIRFNSSMELVKLTDLLRRIPKCEHPDIVVFYDGYNDTHQGMSAGGGNLDPFLAAEIRMLIDGESEKMLSYSAIRLAAKISPFFARIVLPLAQKKFFFARIARTKNLSPENARTSADIYVTNTEMIRAICENRFGIHCLFVLQPMTFTRKTLTPAEKTAAWLPDATRRAYDECYSTIRARMSGRSDFVDASRIFDDIDGAVYIDLGHTNAIGSRRAGEFIGNELFRIIARNNGSPASALAPQAARLTKPVKR